MAFTHPALTALDVLIIDDHAGMRDLLTRVLTAAGASSVREAPDAETALALLAERMASLILADQNMAGMSGLDFVRRFRAQYGARASVLMLSGQEDAEFGAKALVAGADGALPKPVSPRTLLDAIATIIGAAAA
jgi:DNA-binding NarL/FixJ family response regulator